MILMIFIWDSDWGLIGLVPQFNFSKWRQPNKCLVLSDHCQKSKRAACKGTFSSILPWIWYWKRMTRVSCPKWTCLIFKALYTERKRFLSISIHWMVTSVAATHTVHLIVLWPQLSHLIFEWQIIHFPFQTNIYWIFAMFQVMPCCFHKQKFILIVILSFIFHPLHKCLLSIC